MYSAPFKRLVIMGSLDYYHGLRVISYQLNRIIFSRENIQTKNPCLYFVFGTYNNNEPTVTSVVFKPYRT